jgi:predicted P-loop ATPase
MDQQIAPAVILPLPTKDEKTIIAYQAHLHRKKKATAEQIIAHIEKFCEIPRHKSEYLVKQILEVPYDPETEMEGMPKIQVAEKCIMEYGKFRYNVITDNIELNGIPIKDSDVKEIYRKYNPKYSFISTEMIWNLLGSHMLPKFNPFDEFFKEYKDRKPSSTILKIAHILKMDPFMASMFRRWMLGLIECMNGGFSDVMFILCGIKGWGKTVFWRDLLPVEFKKYFLSASLGDLTSDSAKKDFEIRLSRVLLFNDDEMSGKGKRDEKFIKRLLSVEDTLVRASYDRLDKERKRITCFCGTSNTLEILNDPEGNRRFLPYELKEPVSKNEMKQIDRIDLVMEAYWAWKSGEEWRIDPETNKLLDVYTGKFEMRSTEEELLDEHYAIDQNAVAAGIAGKYSFIDIKRHLEKFGDIKNIDERSLRAAIRKSSWTSKLGSNDGKKARYYRVKLICKCTPFNLDSAADEELPF